MAERIGLDGLPKVTEDEALEHCVHHLQMAAIYFMNAPDDLQACMSEAQRLFLRDCPHFKDDPKWVGAAAFLEASWKAHDKAKQADEAEKPVPEPKPDETVQRYLDDAPNLITCPICKGLGRHKLGCARAKAEGWDVK